MKIMNTKRANKIKYNLTLAGLVGALGASNPLVANAEEEVLFTSTDENVTYDQENDIVVTENQDGTITSTVESGSTTVEVVEEHTEGVTPTEDTRTSDIQDDNSNSSETTTEEDKTKEGVEAEEEGVT